MLHNSLVAVAHQVQTQNRVLRLMHIAQRNHTDTETVCVDMDPIPREAHIRPLASVKVKEALHEVKRRRQQSSERYQKLCKQYESIPEEIRTSQLIDHEYREECHSEFASSGMYEGVIATLGQFVKEAEGEFAKSDVDGCFESLRNVLEFLIPIEQKLDMYEKAMKSHVEAARKDKAKSPEEIAKKKAKNARRAAAKKAAKKQEEDEQMSED